MDESDLSEDGKEWLTVIREGLGDFDEDTLRYSLDMDCCGEEETEFLVKELLRLSG